MVVSCCIEVAVAVAGRGGIAWRVGPRAVHADSGVEAVEVEEVEVELASSGL
jgi:hypothetical protein